MWKLPGTAMLAAALTSDYVFLDPLRAEEGDVMIAGCETNDHTMDVPTAGTPLTSSTGKFQFLGSIIVLRSWEAAREQ